MTGKTRCLAVLGHPVDHSFSPGMHQAAFEALRLDYCYIPLDIDPKNLKKAVQALKMFNFVGFNVTVPHKEKMISLMDRLSPEASIIKAVNTVLIQNGKLTGFNTDGAGFIESLKKEWNYSVKNRTVALLGAGGAAKAVAVQMCFEKVRTIGISNRTHSKGVLFKNQLNQHFPDVEIILLPFRSPELKSFIRGSDLLINATSLGLRPGDPSPCLSDFLFKELRVYDLIYNTPESLFLRNAGRLGCRTLNGASMLVYQGALAFNIWTGKTAPVIPMKRAISIQ